MCAPATWLSNYGWEKHLCSSVVLVLKLKLKRYVNSLAFLDFELKPQLEFLNALLKQLWKITKAKIAEI